ncbi:MAG: hypothetical protein IJQ39_06055 [Thermoguttaceae bacterium]|nr:hypothetical protein [Thermoguttaceae bacterium]
MSIKCSCGKYINEEDGKTVLVAHRLKDYYKINPEERGQKIYIYFCECGRAIVSEPVSGIWIPLMPDPLRGNPVEFEDGTRLKEKTFVVRIDNVEDIALDLYKSELPQDQWDNETVFHSWKKLEEEKRNRYRCQAKFLLDKYQINREKPYLSELLKMRDEGKEIDIF